VNLNNDTYQPLLPYAGSIATTAEHLFVARQEGDRTRLEKYDRAGLVWMRRVPDCFDTHSLALVGEQIAVCSTGTNQVILLDASGAEERRWTPEGVSEPDAWHLNSLTSHEGRLFATCFGRFDHFRDWATRMDGSGLLIEVESGRVLVEGLSGPHDPRRVEDGWLVNDSKRARTVLYTDAGRARTIIELTGFFARPGGAAAALRRRLQQSAPPSPPAEMCLPGGGRATRPAPGEEHQRAVSGDRPHLRSPAPEVWRRSSANRPATTTACCRSARSLRRPTGAGAIDALSELRPPPIVPVSLMSWCASTNAGHATWASSNEVPIHLAYQVLSETGDVIFPEGLRTRLPLPLLPGQSVTLDVAIDLSMCAHLAGPAAVCLTLVQESIAWWSASRALDTGTIAAAGGNGQRDDAAWAEQWIRFGCESRARVKRLGEPGA